jgi:hypothetical protein
MQNCHRCPETSHFHGSHLDRTHEHLFE